MSAVASIASRSVSAPAAATEPPPVLVCLRPALCRAFAFWLLCFMSGALLAGEAGCLARQSLQALPLAAVIDGDTLRPQQGPALRLIGINTPELQAADARERILARAARHYLQALLPDARVHVHADARVADRYRRRLVHAFAADGRLLAAELLAAGHGFLVLMPPNLIYADCLVAAEAEARAAGAGVWSSPAFGPFLADQPARLRAGFMRLRGQVVSVEDSRTALWIRLQGDAVLRISAADRQQFAGHEPSSWVGRMVEVSGWLVDRGHNPQPHAPQRARWLMPLGHPALLRFVAED